MPTQQWTKYHGNMDKNSQDQKTIFITIRASVKHEVELNESSNLRL